MKLFLHFMEIIHVKIWRRPWEGFGNFWAWWKSKKTTLSNICSLSIKEGFYSLISRAKAHTFSAIISELCRHRQTSSDICRHQQTSADISRRVWSWFFYAEESHLVGWQSISPMTAAWAEVNLVKTSRRRVLRLFSSDRSSLRHSVLL